MTFIAIFANHHTDCFFLPSSGPHCWPPTLSSLSQPFLTILTWIRISAAQLFLPFPWNEQSPWPCCSSRSLLPPLLTVGDPFLYPFADSPLPNGEPQADARIPTHTEQQSVSLTCARGLAESLWTDALLPSSTPSSGTLYLQAEWWNTGNSLQRDQANLPRRAWSSQSGSWCPRIRPSLFWHPVGEWVQISERNDLNLDVHSSEYTLKGSLHYVLPYTPAQADSQDSQDRERPEIA